MADSFVCRVDDRYSKCCFCVHSSYSVSCTGAIILYRWSLLSDMYFLYCRRDNWWYPYRNGRMSHCFRVRCRAWRTDKTHSPTLDPIVNTKVVPMVVPIAELLRREMGSVVPAFILWRNFSNEFTGILVKLAKTLTRGFFDVILPYKVCKNSPQRYSHRANRATRKTKIKNHAQMKQKLITRNPLTRDTNST